MMNKKMILTGLIISVLIVSEWLHAQTAGNPLGVRGKGEWTVSASMNYSEQQVEDQIAVLRRQAFKVTRGFLPWLDVYVTAGRAQLTLNTDSELISSYHDKYRFMYGIGLSAVLKPETRRSPLQIWLGVQGLRFISEGIYDLYMAESVGSITWKKALEYDWREAQGYLGLSFPIRSNIKLYLAGSFWALQRIDKQRELWNDVWSESQTGTFQSGLWTGGLLGIEFLLPKQYSICCEALAFNEQNFQIMIGISQTGE